MENCYHGNICHPEQRYRRTDIWSTLLQWGKVWETTVLIISAILSKIENKVVFGQIYCPEQNSANAYFDHICNTEQRYGRSDNLTSFTTLGDTQIKWIFAQIYYPGQNCWKMSFGHFCYIEQKCGKLLLWPNLL